MKIDLHREMEGQIVRLSNDPYNPEHYVWVDIQVDQIMKRLMVTQRFAQEQRMLEGEKFSWKCWTIPLLNFLTLHPVHDITNDYPPEQS